VRAACLNVARLAYEDAGIRGLCADGRWEAALTAIRELDLSGVLDLRAGLPASNQVPDR
jgi:pentatricopeptide repeat protein